MAEMAAAATAAVVAAGAVLCFFGNFCSFSSLEKILQRAIERRVLRAHDQITENILQLEKQRNDFFPSRIDTRSTEKAAGKP